MPRLTIAQAVAAHHALRALSTPSPDRPAGTPAPPFAAVLRAARVADALAAYVRAYDVAYAGLQQEFAQRDECGQYVPVCDPNGNELQGQWKLRDLPMFSARVLALNTSAVDVAASSLTTDDVSALMGPTLDVARVVDLLPILSDGAAVDGAPVTLTATTTPTGDVSQGAA